MEKYISEVNVMRTKAADGPSKEDLDDAYEDGQTDARGKSGKIKPKSKDLLDIAYAKGYNDGVKK